VAEAAHLSACPLCGGPLATRAVRGGLRVRFCRACSLGRLAELPDDAYARYREAGYFQFWGEGVDEVERQKRRSADLVLGPLEAARGGRRGLLLEAGCASGELLAAARDRGWQVTGVELCAPMVERANARLGEGVVRAVPFGADSAAPGSVDAIVMNDVLEHFPDLSRALADARALLRPDGTLLVCTPDLESLSSRLLGGRWPHYKAEHLHYLSRTSLAALLSRARFRLLRFAPAWKALSPEYIAEHFRVYAPGAAASALSAVTMRLPRALRRASLPLLSGNLLALAEPM
jgi:SAM-dependent methyltransferase